ncbi:hypothetical protein COBT_001659 [Conglomerata obtusa]
MHRFELFLFWHFIACAESEIKDNYRIERLIKSFSEFNDWKDKETKSIFNKNTQNVYIYIAQNTHDLCVQNVTKSFIKAILSLYCKDFSFPAFNIFSGKIDIGLIYNDQTIFSLIMQIFCKVRLHYKTPIDYENQTEAFIKIRQQNRSILDVHDLEKSDRYDESNFIIIENCVISEEDALYMYKLTSNIHKYKDFDAKNLTMIFALDTKNMPNKYMNKITNGKSILENLSETLYCKSTFLAKIYISKNNSDTQKNTKKIQMGDCHTFDNKFNRFVTKKNIFYQAEQNNLASVFKLYNNIEINNSNNNKKFYLCKPNLAKYTREYSHRILINTFIKKYIFLFQIVKIEMLNYKKDKKDNTFYRNLITIYYLEKSKPKIYGRYSYVENIILPLNNSSNLCSHHTIMLDGQDFFTNFKKNLMILINYTFMNYSDFLPTNVYFLHFVKFSQWINGHTIFFWLQNATSNISYHYISNVKERLKHVYQEKIKFKFFNAKIRHTQHHMNLYYKVNLFNVLRITEVIEEKNLDDTLLKELDFLIFAITIKVENLKPSNLYLIFPFKSRELLRKILIMNKSLQMYHTYDYEFGHEKCLLNFAYPKLEFLLKNMVFNLPLEYLCDFEEKDDFNYMYKDYRLELMLLFKEIKYRVFKIKIDKIFYKQYKLFKENKISERDLYEYIKYTSLLSLLKTSNGLKERKNSIKINILDFYNEFLPYYNEFRSREVYCFHQADIIDINNDNNKTIREISQVKL